MSVKKPFVYNNGQAEVLQTGDTILDAQSEGDLIASATAKITPVDADYFGLMDSAASNILKKLSWASIKAALNSLYPSISIAAYSFWVNNTNSIANVTTKSFQEVGEQALSNAGFVFVGTTAPAAGGTENHRYSWIRMSNKATIWVTIIYANPGTAISGLSFPLPADLPLPAVPTGLTPSAGDNLYPGSGRILQSTNQVVAGSNAGFSVLRRNAANTGYEIFVGGTGVSFRMAIVELTYRCV